MNLIGRFFSWMIRGIIHIFNNIIVWGIRQTISVIRFGWPYFWLVILSALGLALRLSVLHLIALFAGAFSTARQAGKDWAKEAVERGLFPSLHQLILADILAVIAFFAIFAGYLINFFTAFFIVDYAYQWLISR
jgi:hypothetical protein